MEKLNLVKDANGKFVLRKDEDDCYVAVKPNHEFIIEKLIDDAEQFLSETGGRIYLITHYDRIDVSNEVERLPRSMLLKEICV